MQPVIRRADTNTRSFDFPIGYHRMHPVKIIDYQLNRWHSFGYLRLEDMREVAARIRTLEDFKPELIRHAERALAEERLMNACFAYRAAEFFALPDDPDKEMLYQRFRELFDGPLFGGDGFERCLVPYGDASLPALRVQARAEPWRGTIVIHGGFDSFIEELYSWACFFAGRGYDVVLFEGPGQGSALKQWGLPLTHEWEKPARAVLDHFNLDDVTWIGVSMGGWLCFRAAAFEPRIRRVIASSIAFDYLQIPPRPVQWLVRLLLRMPRLMNRLARLKARVRYQERWGMHNMMYITRQPTPIDAARAFLQLNEANLCANRVTQDVLICTGAEDHFIPLKMHRMQVAALTTARSVTERIFTADTQGHNHCQVGNMGLALATMADWIDGKAPLA